MDNLAQRVVTASVVLIALTALAVVIRIWARILILKTIGLDDVLVLAGWIQIASSVTYSWGMVFCKMSFAVLYMRLLPERSLNILNKCLIVMLFVQALEETLTTILKCRPIARSWQPDLDGYCFSLVPMWYITMSRAAQRLTRLIFKFVLNIISDLTLFIEPIPSMLKLQLPNAKKVALVVMLSLGLLVTAISVIRIKAVTEIGSDVTYELAEPLLWSEAELCSLIICSCIPSLRQVAARIPGLNSALGLSSGKASAPNYYPRTGSKGLSIALQSRGRKDYIQSQKSKTQSRHRSAVYGMTSHAEALPRMSDDGHSTDEIFPHKSTQDGGIVVTNEVIQAVESNDGRGDGMSGIRPPHLDPAGSQHTLIMR
ncbi:hypothetical protein BX600DRAFT_429874 [Xylariales sp. PMI_506]|nr:hypothetical protein BX600DRAFT_429874 [Xylariales sp. PMI_506]